MMEYAYTHTGTEATTGYFSCEPVPLPSLDSALRHLTEQPLDDFMRRHVLRRMASMPAHEALQALGRVFGTSLPRPIRTLTAELTLFVPALAAVHGDRDADRQETSLPFLRAHALPDHSLHAAWGALFAANIQRHRALPDPESAGLAPLFSSAPDATCGPCLPGTAACFHASFPVSVPDLFREHAQHPGERGPALPLAAATAALAEERLTALGIIAGEEMRHTSSLSPVALLRPWNMSLRVAHGRHCHVLSGRATTYGRGFSVADARVSCLMEMVERSSVYLSLENDEILHRAAPCPVRRARLSELRAAGEAALDPNDYPLEAPYEDTSLTWTAGRDARGAAVWVPVQMAGLFCNLDELSLFDAQGSTGIATGAFPEQAKLAALLEIVERDAEACTPFVKRSCFVLEADDPQVAALLADYAGRGIMVQFQELRSPLGVPAYKCFVMSRKGHIARGHGAGLSARRAVLSALTETPFSYPDGGPSGPLLRNLPVKKLEDLPDYSLGSHSRDLALLEDALLRNGRTPVYVDLTRAGLEFPVVRAFVPGMALAADSDRFSRVPWRLYANYLSLYDRTV